MSVNRKVRVPPSGAAAFDDAAGAVVSVTPGAALVARGFADLAQPPGHAAKDGEGQCRLREEDLVEVPRREREAARRLLGGHRGIARHLVEHRKLAEELAATEPGDDIAIAD